MQENDYKPVMTIAHVAETGGWIFCVAGIFIGLTLMGSGYLQALWDLLQGCRIPFRPWLAGCC